MHAFRIEDLVVEYRSRSGDSLRVLDGLNLEVERGEFVSLIGPSGCGKTTLLQVLAGQCEIRSGQIHSDGPSLRTAVVFQQPTLLPWRTILENALFGLECRGPLTTADREAATELLKSMDLGEHLGDHPHELSEGMKQRVNLARALLVEPEVLLLDEPFAALDVITRRALQRELRDTCTERGITAVLVSHSLEDVVYLSDRVGVLSDKPTRLIGTKAIELEHPRAVGVAARVAMMEAVEELSEMMASADPAR